MHTASLLFKKAGLESHLPDRYSSEVTEPGSSIPIFYTVLFHFWSFYAGSLQTCRAAAERNSESLLANMTHIWSLLTNMTHAKMGH